MNALRAGLMALVAGLLLQPALESSEGARGANAEIDYFGTNLFLGIAYHRWGCAIDGPYSNSHVTTNNTYQGFTQTQYCVQGWTWSQENSSASTYYGYTSSGNLGDDWLGYYFCEANYDYGEAMADGSNVGDWHNYCHSWQSNYANNSTWDRSSRDPSGAINYCSYNVLTNCNSDCWIGDFSQRQGAVVPTLSPCL
jgi:hypothetical protein